jgi:hypothetical protein
MDDCPVFSIQFTGYIDMDRTCRNIDRHGRIGFQFNFCKIVAGTAGFSTQRNSAEKTVAVTLAQDKMEETIAKGYLNLSSSNQTVVDAYGAMANYLSYRRITDIKIDKPDTDMKLITVDVYWNNDSRWVRLQSMVSTTGPDKR